MNDEEMLKLIYSLLHLNEYRRKELAILLMASTLNPLAVENLAKYMVGLSKEKHEQVRS
jgi:hypothetical protein